MHGSQELLWGKASRSGIGARLSIEQHGLDTAAVAEVLLERQPAGYARLVASALGLSEAAARRFVLFLAATHDLGKGVAEFQCRLPEVERLLRSAGVEVGLRAFGETRHSVVSEALVREYLQGAGWGFASTEAALMVGAHHGEVSLRSEVRKAQGALGVQADWWREAQQELLECFARLFPLPRQQGVGELSGEAFGLISGLLTVADWVASNEEHFPLGRPACSAEVFYQESVGLARRALDAIGWAPGAPLMKTQAEFEELFGFPPRPLQTAAREVLEEAEGPTLLLVEASTGEGKTEAAFDAALELQRRNGHKGVYVAMPTQATGNQLFERFTRFLDKHASEQVSVQLAHGAKGLNEHARSLEARREDPGAGLQNVVAWGWFRRSKAALLVPYVVGTIDQALMGVLNTRHFTLRLFGLSNTTVVLDEVHAYDLYTSGLLLRLLEWLKAMGSSAVVMTATLPPEARKRILAAWGVEGAPEVAYPRVMSASREGVKARTFEGRPVPAVRLAGAPHEEAEVAEHLTELVREGGCVAMIASTIDRAISIYQQVREDPRNADAYVMLLHSRFPAHERSRLEAALTKRFGPPGVGGERPKRAIVVATQVIEQSLDLDFDALVSDLAPVDLLLQRAGRLHRHERGRPEAHAAPVLRIAGFDRQRLPLVRPHGFVYAPYLLYRTWHALRERKALHAPSDSDALMRHVYEETPLLGLSEGQAQAVAEAKEAHAVELGEMEQALRAVRMPPPQKFFDKLPPAPASEEASRAKTRLGLESITFIPLQEQPDGTYASLTGVIVRDLSENPQLDASEALWASHVRVNKKKLTSALKVDAGAPGWKENPHLRDAVPLLLRDNTTRLAGHTFTLDPELGLVIQEG